MQPIQKIILRITSALLLAAIAVVPAAGLTQNSIQNLEFFGVTPKLLDLGHSKFGPKVLEILSTRLGDPKIKSVTFPQVMAFCFNIDKKVYELMLKDSETEGLSLFLTKNPDHMESCAGEYRLPFNFPKKFGLKELKPISKNFSSLQLGISTPAEVEKLFGKPSYKNSTKMIYNLKRDREKEKSCNQNPKKGEFQSINITFFFDSQQKLESLGFIDCISGECGCISS